MDWINIAFKLLANREKIASMYEKVKPVLKNLPQVGDLLKEIDPQLAQGQEVKFSVNWMQESLNELVDAGLVVDGDYGELTRNAVKEFQEKNGLVADGWAGIATCVEIYKKLQERRE